MSSSPLQKRTEAPERWRNRRLSPVATAGRPPVSTVCAPICVLAMTSSASSDERLRHNGMAAEGGSSRTGGMTSSGFDNMGKVGKLLDWLPRKLEDDVIGF
ncbi:unnamed protein product [Caenorhabditis auriculariae]|uniref:Uncharacterized protein n=1 Tax=Caenorhabditis auriculariae TaxID=2777116 RepID=A0A8S1GT22_9PELO|nr:unnamed protein product [Caenorhabditis auriculariae]